MARKKTLEQIFCESYFGIEGGWSLRTPMEKIAFKRAVAAVEAEVLRRLEKEFLSAAALVALRSQGDWSGDRKCRQILSDAIAASVKGGTDGT